MTRIVRPSPGAFSAGQVVGSARPTAANRIVLLDDCSSPVAVPGVVDFTDAAEAAYSRFAASSMRRVLSSDPTEGWL